MGNIVVRAYQPGDEGAICALFAQTYGVPLSPVYWQWRFRDAPAGPGIIELAWDGDVLAAHYAVTPVDFVVDGCQVRTGLSGTTMTGPGYRGRGLFPLLARSTYTRMRDDGFAAVWGFPNTNSHRGFVESLGWRDIHEIPFFESALAPLRLPAERSPDVHEVDCFGSWVDRLSAALYESSPVAVRRDAEYLTWRFLANPYGDYRVLVHGNPDAPDAYAVYKAYGDAIQIVDTGHANDVEPAVRLCEEIARLGRAQVAQRLNMWLPLRAPLHRALERFGFRPAEPITYLGALPFRDGMEALLDGRAWHYSMADSDVY